MCRRKFSPTESVLIGRSERRKPLWRAEEQEDMRTGGQEDRRKGRKYDKKTGSQEDRKTGRQEDSRRRGQ